MYNLDLPDNIDFDRVLTTILSQGIPASEVFQAIRDGLVHVNRNSNNNLINVKELEALMSVVSEGDTVDNSSPEVVLARAGEADLNTTITKLEARLAQLEQQWELQQPYRETRTKTVITPFETIMEYDNTITSAESYTRITGKNGSQVITYEEEFVNGKSTGRVFNERVTSTVQPTNEVRVIGTKIVNPRAIKHIRFGNRRKHFGEGRFSEVEVWVGNTNIASQATTEYQNNVPVNFTDRLRDGDKSNLSTQVIAEVPYAQLNFSTARTDITKLSMYVPTSISYSYAFIDVSSNGRDWIRVLDNGEFYSRGNEIAVTGETLHHGNLHSYSDAIVSTDIPIGGNYTIIASPITLYWDSDRALAKNTYQSGVWYNRGTHKVLNKRTVNGVTVYGFAIGWIRDEDNR